MTDVESHLYPRQDELGAFGACLIGGIDTAVEVIGTVPINAIFFDDIRDSMALIERMATEGRPCDIVALDREWSRVHGNRPKPMELWNSAQDACPSSANAPFFAQGVLEGWRRRKLVEAGSTLAMHAKDPSLTVDEITAEAESALSGSESSSTEIMDGRQAARACIDQLEERHKRQGTIGGVETGFRDLDAMTDGLQPGEQAVIAARPSIGKTAIALAVFEHACLRNEVPSLFVTLEMSAASLMRRMAASWCQIPMRTLRTGRFSDRDFLRLAAYNKACADAPLHIADGVSGLSIASVCSIIRRASRKHGVKLVVVDYLQKIQASDRHEKRTYEVAEVSGRLRSVAVKTGVALLTLAQLNRESEKDKRPPRLSDLADSGQIERDADMVALLHRDRGGPNGSEAKLIVAKQRDGETGLVDLHFDGTHCKFSSATNDHEPA